MTTLLLPCTCNHTFQDETYNTDKDGKPTRQNLRVHNASQATKKDKTNVTYACTVCGAKRTR
jgi:hypothetical protein